MNKQLLTINEFCIYVNVGRTLAYKLINTGKIQALKLGNKTMISLLEADNFLASLPSYKFTA